MSTTRSNGTGLYLLATIVWYVAIKAGEHIQPQVRPQLQCNVVIVVHNGATAKAEMIKIWAAPKTKTTTRIALVNLSKSFLHFSNGNALMLQLRRCLQ